VARHIHVSLRDSSGKSVFAVTEAEATSGRLGAAYEELKYLSQVGEWFLAGVLDGLPDSMCHYHLIFISFAEKFPVMPTVRGTFSDGSVS